MTSVGTHNDASTRELPLARDGTVEVSSTAGRLRIRAHDEEVVRLRVPSGEDIDRVLAFDGDRDRLRIRDTLSGTLRLGPILLSTSRSAPDLELDVPRHARLAVRTVSGDVEAVGPAGETRWATASGDLRLRLDGGPVEAESMSGDVDLASTGPLGATVRTVSGDLHVRVTRLLALAASTTSGDVRVEAELDDNGSHEVTTVSGNVTFATSSEIRLETSTVTGDVDSDLPHRTEGGRGRRTIVVGGGRVTVRVRTMSGDVDLRRPSSAADSAEAPARQPEAPEVPPRPPDPATPPTPPEPPVFVAEAEAAPNLVRAGTPVAASEPDLTASEPTVTASEPEIGRREAARLEVLRALEGGEVDVETASRRLVALDEAGPRSFRGWV